MLFVVIPCFQDGEIRLVHKAMEGEFFCLFKDIRHGFPAFLNLLPGKMLASLIMWLPLHLVFTRTSCCFSQMFVAIFSFYTKTLTPLNMTPLDMADVLLFPTDSFNGLVFIFVFWMVMLIIHLIVLYCLISAMPYSHAERVIISKTK